MELIGRVVRLQAQSASLKVGVPLRFDPAPLRRVAVLSASADGVEGQTEDGRRILDVHNRTHPHSKNLRGVNGISVGFTAHYAAMRDRFGPHLTDGIAGENILVASEWRVSLESLAAGLLIRSDGGQEVRLDRIRVAEPCFEFSRYAERLPIDSPLDGEVKAALQFLRFGMRGYYATLNGEPGSVRLGGGVYRL